MDVIDYWSVTSKKLCDLSNFYPNLQIFLHGYIRHIRDFCNSGCGCHWLLNGDLKETVWPLCDILQLWLWNPQCGCHQLLKGDLKEPLQDVHPPMILGFDEISMNRWVKEKRTRQSRQGKKLLFHLLKLIVKRIQIKLSFMSYSFELISVNIKNFDLM